MSILDRFRLDGRLALVTGASSGLGRHFALTLARAGARVALAARRIDRLQALASEIDSEINDGIARGNGNGSSRAICVAMDVADSASVSDAFATLEADCGPIDILVNNAGVSGESWFTQTGEADWRSVMDVNLDGVWRVGREAATRMQARGQGGTIINIASVLGFSVLKTLSTYAVSKAAVVQLTKAMALELARDNIRVNAIAPGYFSTEINAAFLASPAGQKLLARIPARRAGELAELDGPLLLLASDAGAFMTGSVVTVDGGALLSMG